MFKWLAAKLVAPKIRFSFKDADEGSFYNVDTNHVNLAPTYLGDFGFLRHVRDSHHFNETDVIAPCTWTLLHEVGHSHTWLEDEEEEQMRAILRFMDGTTNPIVQNAYYNLENEWEATEWAIKYIRRHPIFIKLINWMMQH